MGEVDGGVGGGGWQLLVAPPLIPPLVVGIPAARSQSHSLNR